MKIKGFDKLKRITHPRKVYEGWFEMYLIRPFVHHYCDFKGHESGRSMARSMLAWVAVTLGLAGILMGLVGLLGPEAGFSALWVIGLLWLGASLCPLAALLARGSAGAEPDTNGEAAGNQRKYKALGIDLLLGVSCLLFFLLGLLMMVTTLNSGNLNPNATATDAPDTVEIEGEHVIEEPIFTYQEAAPNEETETDSLQDLEDPDQLPPDQSFDPTLSADADALINTATPDSI